MGAHRMDRLLVPVFLATLVVGLSCAVPTGDNDAGASNQNNGPTLRDTAALGDRWNNSSATDSGLSDTDEFVDSGNAEASNPPDGTEAPDYANPTDVDDLLELGISDLAVDMGDGGGLEDGLDTPDSRSETGGDPVDCRLDEKYGTTYFVRTDGGTADQCTGMADAAYPGEGSAQPCAWSHPFWAFPASRNEWGSPGTARIAGGDTLVIGPGSYMMGYGAPGTNACIDGWSAPCFMPSIPSGPDPDHPTRIIGADCECGCPDPPELWGTQRVDVIINLIGSDNVLIAGLEITDHEACTEYHGHRLGGTELACYREDYPFGEWASDGIFAMDSDNVTLRHLNIHGLSHGGIHAGRLSNWTLEDVQIVANGSVGWDGDVDVFGDGSSNSGDMIFRRVVIEWNGCVETYPGGEPTGCWSQTAGGYGDGLGTDLTGGDWVFEDTTISHNTSDGLDLLYLTNGGSVVLERFRAEGNAGNQVKFVGPGTINNSVILGNCHFFDDQAFTFNVDPCRAGGGTLEFYYLGTGSNEDIAITNSTIYGTGGLIYAKPSETGPYTCFGNESFTVHNTIFIGDWHHSGNGERVALFYQDDCSPLRMEGDHNIAWNTRSHDDASRVDPTYPGGQNLFQDPMLEGPLDGIVFGVALTATSPAVDSANPTYCPDVDFSGRSRPIDGDADGGAQCDRGAFELPERF